MTFELREAVVKLGLILFIFFARVIDMSLATMRMILVFRGRRLEGAALGFIEVTVYITALSKIVGSIDNLANLMAYSSGFAAGTLVGSFIEEKLALGLLTVHVFPFPKHEQQMLDELRNAGFGVTVIRAEGLIGERTILETFIRRREWGKLTEIVRRLDPATFVAALDTKVTLGGTFNVMKVKAK